MEKQIASKFDCLLNLDQILDTHYQEYEKLYTQREVRYQYLNYTELPNIGVKVNMYIIAISENWRRDFRR